MKFKDKCIKFDTFCQKHEVMVGIIGCTLSFIILSAAGAF